ncbi:Ubiquitin-protein ligase [Rhynchospora pubera]|uniref:Ubiquitin-protein ligase n=1 Tax=Rhynchospora pubera TaxID=906938 RepID=A0AAV8DZP5_9POAL|nr:Ubiquitin-protein ligase [Rhynchospora pubera]
MRKLHLPETIGMMCCASERGWLLLVATGGTELFLLNPITRACIQLPPFTTPVKRLSDFFMIPPEIIREAWDIFPSYDVRDYFEPVGGNFAISRVTFSTDLTDPACLITVFIPRYQGIFCCRVGSSCWTEVHDRHYSSSEFADLTYYNGQFYILHKEIMLVIDPSKASCRTGIICFFEQEIWPVSKFLVQGKYGVYVVFVHNIEEEDEAEEVRGQKYENVPKVGTEKMLKQKFELYQFSEQSPRLLRMITNTSNTAIFFGDNNHCLSVCTDNWDSLEGGSVYRCAPPSIRDMHGSGSHYNVYSAKMDDGKFELVPSDFAKEASIGRSGPAIWFQPNFF